RVAVAGGRNGDSVGVCRDSVHRALIAVDVPTVRTCGVLELPQAAVPECAAAHHRLREVECRRLIARRPAIRMNGAILPGAAEPELAPGAYVVWRAGQVLRAKDSIQLPEVEPR